MMYYNTILHYGVEAFVKRCNEAGVDGLIVPDLPFEEQEELMTALDASEDTILIQLVSPVSGARIPKILAGARGFVYCVSSMGVTGQGAEFHKEVRSYLTSDTGSDGSAGDDGLWHPDGGGCPAACGSDRRSDRRKLFYQAVGGAGLCAGRRRRHTAGPLKRN